MGGIDISLGPKTPMMDALNIAATALQAQGVNVGVIANNVANAETPGYTPQQTNFIAMNPGVTVGPIIASSSAEVDLGSELVNLIMAQQAYAAAAKVASASITMTHNLLNAI
jgi:flagellar hook-associated protein 1